MPILEDIVVDMAKDTLLAQRMTAGYPSKLQKEFARAVDLSKNLLRPKAAYRRIPVLDNRKDRIVCYDRESNQTVQFVIGRLGASLRNAKSILVGIATIGPGLDETIREMNQTGDYPMAYFLDRIGVAALEQVTTAVCSVAEKAALLKNWGVSPFLSPGAHSAWALKDQKKLFGLVPTGGIGVRLNASQMMMPLKSVSGMIAMGPEFTSGSTGSLCTACSHATACNMHNQEKRGDMVP